MKRIVPDYVGDIDWFLAIGRHAGALMLWLLGILLAVGPLLAAPTTRPADFSKESLTELYAMRRLCEAEIARLNGTLARINGEIGKRLAEKIKDEKALGRALPKQEIIVHASNDPRNMLDTGMEVLPGEKFILFPNRADRWCGGGTKRGKPCDYRGYGPAGKWMALRWTVGGIGGIASYGAVKLPKGTGKLYLWAQAGGIRDEVRQRRGQIRVEIVVIPKAAR